MLKPYLSMLELANNSNQQKRLEKLILRHNCEEALPLEIPEERSLQEPEKTLRTIRSRSTKAIYSLAHLIIR